MGWTTPPTFTAGETSGLTAALNVVSGDLVALNSSPQLNSITTSPLAGGSAPSLNAPNFLLDVNYQQQAVAGSGGQATFNFGATFPNGVLTVVAMPSDGTSVLGLTVNLVRGSVTTSQFTVSAYYLNSGNYVVVPNATSISVSWIAVGW
jgi:hypothetical protein